MFLNRCSKGIHRFQGWKGLDLPDNKLESLPWYLADLVPNVTALYAQDLYTLHPVHMDAVWRCFSTGSSEATSSPHEIT